MKLRRRRHNRSKTLIKVTKPAESKSEVKMKRGADIGILEDLNRSRSKVKSISRNSYQNLSDNEDN